MFVRRRTVFARTVFSEDLLILTVTGFSDFHSAVRKSTHAIITVTSYLVGRGLVAPSQESHPALGPSGTDPVSLLFNADLRPWADVPHLKVLVDKIFNEKYDRQIAMVTVWSSSPVIA